MHRYTPLGMAGTTIPVSFEIFVHAACNRLKFSLSLHHAPLLDYSIPIEELTELRNAHLVTRDKRVADRIKAVELLAIGWNAKNVAKALLIAPLIALIIVPPTGEVKPEC